MQGAELDREFWRIVLGSYSWGELDVLTLVAREVERVTSW